MDTLFEARCDQIHDALGAGHLAVDADGTSLTYRELDQAANRLARYLQAGGIVPGARVGLMFDTPWRAYAAMLAVLKVHATYVPLDPGFPADRLKYIIDDADVSLTLTLSHLAGSLPREARIISLDLAAPDIEDQDPARRTDLPAVEDSDDLAYIIYTSGSTGRPKGVEITHSSICNFVQVAAEVYGIEPRDRVYQGMTIAFDFSVEEIWVPWMAGATLVPKPQGAGLLGADLAEFIRDNTVTALCCVPTLLATIDEDLPDLRFLLVSGEACPRDLIARWHRPGRRFLNVYGPTEATVTATWSVADPHRTVTLGQPLPTYTAVILDPERPQELPHGEVGEIALAGIGLARGYVNRQDLTDRAFIPDFLDLADNPSHRIYRTGDLGRINDEGQIDYLGRIDTQVKVRGYRIELTEIESTMLQVPGIAQAVASSYEPEPGYVELVAHYSLRGDTESIDEGLLRAFLRERLPGYMVPAYIDRLDVIPMLTSGKADRKSLPKPHGQRSSATSNAYVPPATDLEKALAEALAQVLHVDKVSVGDHFFDDLGANSLLLAHFAALLRRKEELPPIAMREMYQNPTITTLAGAIAAEGTVTTGASPYDAGPPVVASTAQYLICGTLQALCFLLVAFAASSILLAGFLYASAGETAVEVLGRAFLYGTVTFTVLCVLPIAAKWVLVGRWRVEEIPVWSLRYLRFWAVKALIRGNPLRMFVGTPVYVLYLRALGAKIGPRVAIFAAAVPVCTDLLTIGEETVVRKDSSFTCYRAYRGRIQTGPVTIGTNAVIGEASVLDIGASVGNSAQLGHASSLHASQSVPDGQSWEGSPARRCTSDFRLVDPAPCSTRRRVTYGCVTVFNRLVLLAPIGLGSLSLLLPQYFATDHLDHSDALFYVELLGISFILFFGLVITGLLVLATVPRLLNRAVTPDRVYPLYSWPYAAQRAIARMTNLRFYMELSGDSSLIVHYLRLLGYKQPGLVQTGSNFGVALKHENPFAVTIGSGTMVADGLSIMNADVSSSSFRISPTVVGASSFFGNNIVYPPTASTAENCLLATKVMVPLGGPDRRDVGLLGSPAFEIPRSVQRDSEFKWIDPVRLRTELRAKNRHNGVTIAYFLISRWILTFVALLLSSFSMVHFTVLGVLAVAAGFVSLLLFTAVYFILIERASLGFGRLEPLFCSIYDQRFWRHERFWKLSATNYLEIFNGTPFKNLIWKLLGVRIGRRVFDDGCSIPEKTIVSIGDDCTLNALSTIQCHSMEDGAFKVDGISIGSGCTIGVNAFIHYGVTMQDSAVLEPDSFLMKGQTLPPGSIFGGNPAQEIRRPSEGTGPSGRSATVTGTPPRTATIPRQ
ncbi:Pls/PosA family non-ribosomal peptide synthetase [Arthrobacter pityocampae]|uniref:Pls/PosA family non-ribosomal peptide synthetase n=1 Tax=Arthrobacter pityocampae TaxID=547334 RepID=UPI001F4EEF2A|nr:Pls/PosA family non-ribosomal peptide synthetase [Arthrobacter pityocampae]